MLKLPPAVILMESPSMGTELSDQLDAVVQSPPEALVQELVLLQIPLTATVGGVVTPPPEKVILPLFGPAEVGLKRT